MENKEVLKAVSALHQGCFLEKSRPIFGQTAENRPRKFVNTNQIFIVCRFTTGTSEPLNELN